jgi:hypothetical protein
MSVLRLSFSATHSGDIHIASQSDRKNPIHNPARLFLNFQQYRVYLYYIILDVLRKNSSRQSSRIVLFRIFFNLASAVAILTLSAILNMEALLAVEITTSGMNEN